MILYCRFFIRYAFICTLLCFTGSLTVAYAGRKGCRARALANWGKKMTCEDYVFTELSFSQGDNTIRITGRDHYDSVFVSAGGVLKTSFKAGHAYNDYHFIPVLSPYILYDDGDAQLVDSLGPHIKNGKRHRYFTIYGSDQVAITHNLKEHSLLYFRPDGSDSVYIRYHPGGLQLRHMVWYDASSRDTASKQWDAAGRLTHYSNRAAIRTYYSGGTLQLYIYDTVIASRTVECRKTFHTNGSPDSVTYHYCSQPCHTWRYYNEHGILVKTVKKPPVASFPQQPETAEAPEPPFVFTYVEQLPEYPGGNKAFMEYMDRQLTGVLCSSTRKLRGRYVIRAQIGADDGRMTFLDVTGLHAAAITSNLQRIFAAMPVWMPGRKYGSRIGQTVVFRVSVN